MPTDTLAENARNLQINRDAHRVRWGVDPCAWMTAGRPGAVGSSTARGNGQADAPFQIQVPDGAWHQVHDPIRPLEEARAWLASVADAARGASSICVIGAGAGWVIDAIQELPGEVRMLVLEPEPVLCAALMERRDYRRLIETGRLMVLSGPDFEEGAGAWRVLGRITIEPPMLVHPVIAVGRREATLAAARLAKKASTGALANETARRHFAAPYLLNTLRNVPALARESDAGVLLGLYPGAPVVIAGAGPSLNRNLEELRPYRDRAILITADTALRPCLAAGLSPDFVVAVDPGIHNARHLTRLPANDAVLVAEASVQSESLESFAGRTYLFRIAGHDPWPWIYSTGVKTTWLHAWGSVLITAFDFGVKLGGDPVALIGADLSYTGGQPYCRNTVYEEDWDAYVANGWVLEDIWKGTIARHPVVVEEVEGQQIDTTSHFMQFRDGLVQAAQSASCQVVNATGAGILRGGRIEQGTLQRLLANKPSLTRRALPRRGLDPDVATNLERAVRDLQSAASPPAEWMSILREHEPPDPSLPAQLSELVGRLLG